MEAMIMWSVLAVVLAGFIVYLVLAIRGDDETFAHDHDEDVRS